ncbi:7-carboxy-7-deazaguanine synthase, partial [Sphingopyxis sp.]
AVIAESWGEGADDRYVVLTGGEPMLQVDAALIDALHAEGFTIAIETNGTQDVPRSIDWICVSPKAGSELVQRSGDELKLVWPQAGSDVAMLADLDFAHRLIQPLDDPNAAANVQACIDLVMADPRWRLSLQTHKSLGLR